MISFYPGPSRLHPSISLYMQEAFDSGILSVNHRSPEFIALSKQCIHFLKLKLSIPEGYSVFYTSSATECWEIIAQSLVKKHAFHIYNGAFGQKWFEYAKALVPEASFKEFSAEQELTIDSILTEADVICVTQNETSNGTYLDKGKLSVIRNAFPQSLLAVDITSSLGGTALDFASADVWLASVQKCLGLPAGMGLLICSPKAIERAEALNEKQHYNSLLHFHEKMQSWQTPYTPNVLAIYLLKRVMEDSPSIAETDRKVWASAQEYYKLLSVGSDLRLLVKEASLRSGTVIAVEGEKNMISAVKEDAKKHGLLLGNGYGALAETTFRIANFPSIMEAERNELKDYLLKYL